MHPPLRLPPREDLNETAEELYLTPHVYETQAEEEAEEEEDERPIAEEEEESG